MTLALLLLIVLLGALTVAWIMSRSAQHWDQDMRAEARHRHREWRDHP